MAHGIKETLMDAGQKVVETAKTVGNKIAEGASQAKDWVKEKAGFGESCGAGRSIADIKERMDVFASDGTKVGVVDHVEGGAIKLTRADSLDGQHHFIPTSWVDHVDSHVHLSKTAMETEHGWRSDAAACAGCGT